MTKKSVITSGWIELEIFEVNSSTIKISASIAIKKKNKIPFACWLLQLSFSFFQFCNTFCIRHCFFHIDSPRIIKFWVSWSSAGFLYTLHFDALTERAHQVITIQSPLFVQFEQLLSTIFAFFMYCVLWLQYNAVSQNKQSQKATPGKNICIILRES